MSVLYISLSIHLPIPNVPSGFYFILFNPKAFSYSKMQLTTIVLLFSSAVTVFATPLPRNVRLPESLETTVIDQPTGSTDAAIPPPTDSVTLIESTEIPTGTEVTLIESSTVDVPPEEVTPPPEGEVPPPPEEEVPPPPEEEVPPPPEEVPPPPEEEVPPPPPDAALGALGETLAQLLQGVDALQQVLQQILAGLQNGGAGGDENATETDPIATETATETAVEETATDIPPTETATEIAPTETATEGAETTATEAMGTESAPVETGAPEETSAVEETGAPEETGATEVTEAPQETPEPMLNGGRKKVKGGRKRLQKLQRLQRLTRPH